MSPLLVNVFKVLFVAVLYLFLWFVARAIRSHLAAPAAAAAAGRAAHHVLFVTEPAAMAGLVLAVEEPTLLGRSREADITIDDPFISERHVRFDRMENRIVVEDLGSTNGTTVNGLPITGRRVLDRGDVVGIGHAIMEVR